jgi:mercuric ion transport protein
MKVEFVYEKTCPNIAPAREQLALAFGELGMAPDWQEWEVSDPRAPAYIHGYGSPTILINGADVLGAKPNSDDMSCRIYPDSPALNQGVPAVFDLVKAMQAASRTGATSKTLFGLNLGILPMLGIALLPKIFCPACWPAYAGLLSSLGLGFFDYTPYMLPMMAIFIAVALVALAWRASRRRGYAPFLLGLFASVILLVSKFYFDNDPAMWTGLALLVTASLWNTWPQRVRGSNCVACQV